MNGIVKFHRTKNRTAEDVFKNMIRPKLPHVLDTACQQITHYNKHHHTYQNQTGALENSITWSPAVMEGPICRAAVMAGGLSRATRAGYSSAAPLAVARRIAGVRVRGRDGQRRSITFRSAAVKSVSRGDQIYVNYAVYVERKGYPVLKQGIEYYRPRLAAQMAALLRQNDIAGMAGKE